MRLKRCEGCGCVMALKIFPSGTIESPSLYKKRRFCSIPCANRFLRERPLEIRFAEKIDKHGPIKPHMDTPCHLWIGVKGRDGYGHIHSDRHHAEGAHRVAWRLGGGREPKPNEDVLHHCDVRICVRFDHLYLGDDYANQSDRNARNGPRLHPERCGYRYTDEQHHQIAELFAAGWAINAIAQKLKVSRPTVKRWIQRGAC